MTKLQMNNSPCDSPVSTNERSLLRAVAGNRAFLGALVVSGAVFLYSANSKTENSEDIPPQPVPAAMVPPELIPETIQNPARNKVIESIVPEAKANPSTAEVRDPEINQDLSENKRVIANHLLKLPLDEFKSAADELTFSEVPEIIGLYKALQALQEAASGRDGQAINEAAIKYMKATSLFETDELRDIYRHRLHDYRQSHNGSKGPIVIFKSVWMSADNLAELLTEIEQ